MVPAKYTTTHTAVTKSNAMSRCFGSRRASITTNSTPPVHTPKATANGGPEMKCPAQMLWQKGVSQGECDPSDSLPHFLKQGRLLSHFSSHLAWHAASAWLSAHSHPAIGTCAAIRISAKSNLRWELKCPSSNINDRTHCCGKQKTAYFVSC
jgi:hypothetical protein